MDNLHIKHYVLSAILTISIFFTSCNTTSPKDHQTEIEDATKFSVALCNVIVEEFNETFANNLWVYLTSDVLDSYYSTLWAARLVTFANFGASIENLYSNEENNETYKDLLKRIANDKTYKYQEIAKKVYDEYERTSVVISKYTRIETTSNIRIWTYQELNTGLGFKITYNRDDNSWSYELDEESFFSFLKRNNVWQ